MQHINGHPQAFIPPSPIPLDVVGSTPAELIDRLGLITQALEKVVDERLCQMVDPWHILAHLESVADTLLNGRDVRENLRTMAAYVQRRIAPEVFARDFPNLVSLIEGGRP